MLQQKLVERLAEAASRTEQLSTRLADRGAAQAETRARLTESLRELRIEEKPAARRRAQVTRAHRENHAARGP